MSNMGDASPLDAVEKLDGGLKDEAVAMLEEAIVEQLVKRDV